MGACDLHRFMIRGGRQTMQVSGELPHAIEQDNHTQKKRALELIAQIKPLTEPATQLISITRLNPPASSRSASATRLLEPGSERENLFSKRGKLSSTGLLRLVFAVKSFGV